MSKSFVKTERRFCMVCAKHFLTGALLIVRRKEKVPDEWGMCPDHQRLKDRNLVALVEVDPTKSKVSSAHFETRMAPEHAHRTGTVAYIARDVFMTFFHDVAPDNGVCFVDNEVITLLQRFKHKLEGKEDN